MKYEPCNSDSALELTRFRLLGRPLGGSSAPTNCWAKVYLQAGKFCDDLYTGPTALQNLWSAN